MNNSISFGIIILAAGSSSRLGRSKQLLPLNNKTLLGKVIGVAAKAPASHIIVVVNEQLRSYKPDHEQVHVLVNEDSKDGIASSIKKGLNELVQIAPAIEAAIVMVCDQPFVSHIILNDLIRQYLQTAKPIIASSYAETFGTPALFHRSYFPRLLSLQGDAGAKKIITKHREDMSTIEFAAGSIDIDTAADWEKWKHFSAAL